MWFIQALRFIPIDEGLGVGRGSGYLTIYKYVGLPIFFKKNICFGWGGGGGSEFCTYFRVSRIKSIFFGVKIFMDFFLVWWGHHQKWAIFGIILGSFLR